jgi:hypothetical protein
MAMKENERRSESEKGREMGREMKRVNGVLIVGRASERADGETAREKEAENV